MDFPYMSGERSPASVTKPTPGPPIRSDDTRVVALALVLARTVDESTVSTVRRPMVSPPFTAAVGSPVQTV